MDAATRFWSKVEYGGTGCWLWTGKLDHHDYGRFSVGGRWVGAAKWLADRLWGAWPGDTAHHCDNPPCVRPSHLYQATHAQNMADQRARGRAVDPPRHDGDEHWTRRHPERRLKGERHGRAKLTDEQVEHIRRSYADDGQSLSTLARQFGVGKSQVGRIVRGASRTRQAD